MQINKVQKENGFEAGNEFDDDGSGGEPESK